MRIITQKVVTVVGACILSIVLVIGCRMLALHFAAKRIACPHCNVVILDLDVFRSDELTCVGKSIKITPNLCKLVAESTRFTKVYSQSFWTLPSALSTYTSLYPNVNQVWEEQKGALSLSTVTLAEYLEKYGYTTHYVGDDNDALLSERNGGLRGYAHTYLGVEDELKWLDILKNAMSTKRPVLFHAYSEGFHIPYLLFPPEKPIRDLPKPNGFPTYIDEYERVKREYLIQHVQEIFPASVIAAHPEIFQSDLSVRGKKLDDFLHQLEDSHDYTQRLLSWEAIYNPYMQFIHASNPQDVAYLKMLYETKLHTVDQRLAGLIAYLLKPDIKDHTIVIVTSSHGEAFAEHGEFSHADFPYNEIYHVPLIVNYPANTNKRSIDAVIENLDIYPTLTDLVTGSVPHKIQGVSLTPLLSGVSISAKPYAVSMNYEDTFVIQSRRYALVRYRDRFAKPELYDLITDPGETHNVAKDHPQIVKRYTDVLIKEVAPELLLPPSFMPIPYGNNQQKLIRSGYF